MHSSLKSVVALLCFSLNSFDVIKGMYIIYKIALMLVANKQFTTLLYLFNFSCLFHNLTCIYIYNCRNADATKYFLEKGFLPTEIL